jgi:PAS domain S-box-containing protein
VAAHFAGFRITLPIDGKQVPAKYYWDLEDCWRNSWHTHLTAFKAVKDSANYLLLLGKQEMCSPEATATGRGRSVSETPPPLSPRGQREQAMAKGVEKGTRPILVSRRAAFDPGSVTSTAALLRRPSRPPDYAAESRALVALAQELAGSPDRILQKLADTALTLCRAHSAGLSLLEEGDQKRNFHWRAIAGQWVSHLGGGTPRDFGPCGTVLDRNAPQMLSRPERDFPYFAEVTPGVEEGLLIPFYIGGEAMGTVWVVAHDKSCRFDAEDLRVMTNLGIFAGAAYQTLLSLNATIKVNQELQQSVPALQRFASIVESSDDAIISKNLDGVISTWNKGAERIFGYTAQEIIGKSISILIPPDRHNEEPRILERIRRGERIDHYETIRRRKDGNLIDISLTVSPVKNAEGRITGASKIARDITERRQAQEQQNLLLREMSHRVKNLFAVTSGLVSVSARSARTPQEMATAVQERLAALTRAQELTRPGLTGTGDKAGQDTTLHALIRTIFAPYVDRGSKDGEGIVVTGPDLPIGEKAVTGIALVLHELATNAAKYGALSSKGGVVHLECSVENDELLLTWKEQGGPSLNASPDAEGFGSKLTRRIITQQFGGRLSNEWEPDGLVVHISVPLQRLNA